ncbi:protein-glutamate methylesterase/protein-glutamine glutaminase [Desulfosporosinus nitroreducens]|uniref:Protein-glutamate methylesterase/protein-glutamine glutaminase n=1 Tax=Desulfosporosinus nitroreducens TaxID=2018668 RepID=A0ABT8QV61_9FIRM|nr:chemotaxis response regulator protein-glutamate methylesterase [Desulfosporosinus nitroreducens]MDO0825238.1 chemotaxis response regulator protein-glutamate methylesterase [Desulfosporosinus nitroreducens]
MRKIKVLVVDDSLVFREVLARGISTDPYIEVVAKAVDPFDARDKILEYSPDVMTCDIEMPKMNGIEFIKRLLPQYPLPVVVVSSVSMAVFEAMKAGAVDFVTKPNVQSVQDVHGFIHELIQKIKVAANAKVSRLSTQSKTDMVEEGASMEGSLIAIGASTGGTEAVFRILKDLPTQMPGIVIAQHIPPVFSRMFADRLNNSTQMRVKEAETGDYVDQGSVLIAPGGQHLRLKKFGNRYRAECFEGEKVNGHCPSIDVLFESVAKEVGKGAIGVILTGMGYDGSKGLLSMRRRGARTLGQDELTSVVYGMPKVAFEIGAVEKQVSLDTMAQALVSILGNRD